MRRIFFAVILVITCATGATAGSIEEAKSAYDRGDYAEAAQRFRPLAELGDATAQFYLGWMYYEEQRNDQEAAKWYQKAAEQGLVRAQLHLGLMYVDGRGVLQNLVRGHMWINVAAATSSGDDGKDSVMFRDNVASRMTAAQIAKAQEMARRCQETKFKECD